MRCNGSNWAVYSPGSWDGFRNDLWAWWAGVIMCLEHHLVGGYVRYISQHIIIIIIIIKICFPISMHLSLSLASFWYLVHPENQSEPFLKCPDLDGKYCDCGCWLADGHHPTVHSSQPFLQSRAGTSAQALLLVWSCDHQACWGNYGH